LRSKARISFLLIAAGFVAHTAQAAPVADRLVLATREHTLTLFRGDEELKTFRVSLGKADAGKEHQGDHRTPVGTYRLFAARPSKRFHRFLPVSYPNVADADRGFEAGLITAEQRDAIVDAAIHRRMPPQNTRLGGSIGIHGLGHTFWFLPRPLQILHRLVDGTDGCILLTDGEVDDLEHSYVPGATLEIR
jgi:murein L,D-transpeptidase YafK